MENAAESFRLIPDAKATLALFFPPFWLAWHRLWLPLMVYFVVIIAIAMLAFTSPSIAVSYLSILPGFYLLLEGYELVRKNLENTGWRYAGIVEGENREEAEIRFIMNSEMEFEHPKTRLINEHKPTPIKTNPYKTNMSLFPE